MTYVYTMQAFASAPDEGNAAGVVLQEAPGDPAPSVVCGSGLREEAMQRLAAELNYSETAFVQFVGSNTVRIRYFTPLREIEMCGHATVASFALLLERGILAPGRWILETQEASYRVLAEPDRIWIDFGMPQPEEVLTEEQTAELCRAYGLTPEDLADADRLPVQKVTAGIPDIHMIVRNQETLLRAEQDAEAVCEISRRLQAVGVHMSCIAELQEGKIRCSNFAPLYGIAEECATGTSNAGLTALLYSRGLLAADTPVRILQGEHMHRLGHLWSRAESQADGIHVMIGGQAVCTGSFRKKEE